MQVHGATLLDSHKTRPWAAGIAAGTCLRRRNVCEEDAEEKGETRGAADTRSALSSCRLVRDCRRLVVWPCPTFSCLDRGPELFRGPGPAEQSRRAKASSPCSRLALAPCQVECACYDESGGQGTRVVAWGRLRQRHGCKTGAGS